MKHQWVTVFDCDGVFTDGSFYYTKEGKCMKAFGPDDFDAVNELKNLCDVQIITGDKKGFDITKKRMDDVNISCDLVPTRPFERWCWIKNKYPEQKIIFVGDGIYDWYSLAMADFGITTCDALEHVKEKAKYISQRKGGNRFVADACLKIMRTIFFLDTRAIGI